MRKLYTEEHIQAIADAIRDKLGSKETYKVADMAEAIMNISSDGKGVGGRNYIFISDAHEHHSIAVPHDVDTVWLSSDTVLKADLSLNDIDCDEITDVQVVNRLLLKLTLDQSKVKAGDQFSIRLKSSAYENNNGNSDSLRLPVKNTLEFFDQTELGRRTIASTYSDSGTCTVPVEKYGVIGFENLKPTLTGERTVYRSVNLDGNCILTIGSSTLKVNNRDNGYLNIYLYEIPMDDVGGLTRITWNGYMPYNQQAQNLGTWDVYFIPNGDFYVRITGLGQNGSGVYQRNDENFKNPGAGGYVSFYRLDYFGTRFVVDYEMYDPDKHHPSADALIRSCSMDEMLKDRDSLSYIMKADVDDQTFTSAVTFFAWPYAGANYSTFYPSTNAWIGILSSGSEDIKINRRDAKANQMLHGVYYLSELDLRCYKFRWVGYSHYSSTSTKDQIYEVYFFENGDAMIYLERKGNTQGGTYSFFGVNYTINAGEYVSFYRTSESSSGWNVEHEIYDIEKHIA